MLGATPAPPHACMLLYVIKNQDDFSFASFYSRLDSFPRLTAVIEVSSDNTADYDTVQLRCRSVTW
jgi:hypothetical protein